MSSVTVLQTTQPTNSTTSSTSSTTTPASSTTTPLGPFQAGGKAPLRKPAPINPLAQSCQGCGADLTHSRLAEDSQRRIAELEAQVKILTTKATAAVDKLADYEDELRRLKSTPQTPISASDTIPPESTLTPRPQPQQQPPPQATHPAQQHHPPADRSRNNRSPSPAPPAASTTPTPIPPPAAPPVVTAPPQPPQPEKPAPRPTTASRLTSLLPSASVRRTASSSPLISPRTPKDLQALLTQEQTLRLAAERRVTQTNSEIEELSAQLFTEANEMVATERKARARLEERVVVLEKREREKAGRLEVLERRVGRVERVRGILAQGGVVQIGGG